MLVDEGGNTLLHNAKSASEVMALLKSRLIDVDAMNKVWSFVIDLVIDLLLTIDTRSHMLSDSQILHARLITTPTIPANIYLGWPNAARNTRRVARAEGGTRRRRS